MKTKILSAVISVCLAGCALPLNRVRRANGVELYRLRQQADAMTAATSGIVFLPLAQRKADQ